jgi:hypothetical protein
MLQRTLSTAASASQLPAAATSPAAQVQLSNAPTTNGIISISGNINLLPIPQAYSQVIVSTAGVGAEAVTAYMGNEDTYNVTPTDNGSGAGTVTNNYGDGWSGKGYNKLFTAGPGVQFYGFTLVFTVAATGVQDAAGIQQANPTHLSANFVGAAQIPVGFVLGIGLRNTIYQEGTMTVRTMFVMNIASQLSYSVPAGDKASLVLMTADFSS